MENTTLKAENLKPIILKAGAPLAVSIAGVIYAWLMSKKVISKSSSIHEDTSYQSLSSVMGEDDQELDDMSPTDNNSNSNSSSNSTVPSGRLVIHDNPCLEQDIGGLRSKIEGLQLRELALNLQFERFCDMKEQGSLLVEIKNMLSIEAARAEFLDKEISSLERVNLRLENFVVQYLRIVEKVEYWRSENRLLQNKVQKLIRKSKARNCLIKEQDMKIKAGEEEILRSHDELKTKICVINKLEDEIKEMQGVLDQLQDEKNELVKKLDIAEKAYASKVEEADVSKEDYNKLLNELERVKKEREDEVEELIHLRWTNACLRHELMRHQKEEHQKEEQQQEQQQHDLYNRDNIGFEFEGIGSGVVMHYESDHELHHSFMDHNNLVVPCFGSGHSSSDHHVFSKRKRLLRRLKRWVKPFEGENHVRNNYKCLGMHSVPHVAKETTTHVPARRSFSGA